MKLLAQRRRHFWYLLWLLLAGFHCGRRMHSTEFQLSCIRWDLSCSPGCGLSRPEFGVYSKKMCPLRLFQSVSGGSCWLMALWGQFSSNLAHFSSLLCQGLREGYGISEQNCGFISFSLHSFSFCFTCSTILFLEMTHLGLLYFLTGWPFHHCLMSIPGFGDFFCSEGDFIWY